MPQNNNAETLPNTTDETTTEQTTTGTTDPYQPCPRSTTQNPSAPSPKHAAEPTARTPKNQPARARPKANSAHA